MQQHLGGIAVEIAGAESPKFTAPLMLIHGLWCAADVWRRWSGFLAHRGWACHAISLQGGSGTAPATHWMNYEQRIAAVISALDAAPVLIGHDLGGLLALRVADRARAVVALAPHLPRSLRGDTEADLVSPPSLPFLAWRRFVTPPRGTRGRRICSDLQLLRSNEPRAVIQSLLHEEPAIEPSDTPTLLMIGAHDPFVSRTAIEQAALHMGATVLVAEDAGHGLPVETGWERRVNDVHRWLIKALGDPLLALREESETE